MTYKEFCNRIEEELATGDNLTFTISDETFGNLLTEAEKVTVSISNFTLSFHEIPIVIFYEPYSAYLLQFGNQYLLRDSATEAMRTSVPARTVPL